jgi:hypothetical protein
MTTLPVQQVIWRTIIYWNPGHIIELRHHAFQSLVFPMAEFQLGPGERLGASPEDCDLPAAFVLTWRQADSARLNP